MTVHGLTEDMTVRAAREASLGAGAVLYHYTVGEISAHDMKTMSGICPNIIFLAGGVDHGERDRVLAMAQVLAHSTIVCPVIYAGNCALAAEIKDIFSGENKELHVTENVYPRVDHLNMRPARNLIQQVFSRHILHAPGMEKISSMISDKILPVPGTVLSGLEMLTERLGDAVAIDIGGATTDIHSVTDGSPLFAPLMVEPEPRVKRTVEGDLGVFVNASAVMESSGDPWIEENMRHLSPMPQTAESIALSEQLAYYCLYWGLMRHAGEVSDYYGPTGKKQIVRGKDLTAVKAVIGTGGALTQLPFGEKLLRRVLIKNPVKKLLPLDTAEIIIDKDYLLGTIGLISHWNPETAFKLAKKYFS